MLYVLWVIGVLLAVVISAKLTIKKEYNGNFDH
ncbi:Uncharacterised protein [Haemophilus pittmaniae]|uniref:Cytochrome bd oxidase small subunit, CydX/CbdX family n=1 Tax=Haemophilus pittmaniae TaxID=249188 RepID=A0A377IYA7_9PAST|nr:Uncharacterised protein [Haemophilus pittmaniae]STO93244.1 Uncharacterised protein [Haemophilus pittmaniae]